MQTSYFSIPSWFSLAVIALSINSLVVELSFSEIVSKNLSNENRAPLLLFPTITYSNAVAELPLL